MRVAVLTPACVIRLRVRQPLRDSYEHCAAPAAQSMPGPTSFAKRLRLRQLLQAPSVQKILQDTHAGCGPDTNPDYRVALRTAIVVCLAIVVFATGL